MPTIKNKREKARFAIVGIANTILDFGILFILTNFGLPSIGANYISTSIAFISSFVINRKFTFQVNGGNVKRQLMLFLIVTMIGLWVIQPIIIWFIEPIFIPLGFAAWVSLLSAKLIATVASVIWNYVLYSRLVFPTKQRD